MTDSVRELLEKAEQSIGAAELLVKDSYIDFGASRAYYAMFYTIEALLLSRDLSFSKHSAVIAAFGKEFVKAGIFDNRFHRYILDAFDLRNAGDYGAINAVSEEKARQTIREARELLEAVRNHLTA
ncbi:HEPN domain-containing protein [Geomobilimonas luticola]|uniref:HEPN domain-containing protein n=1 Tax=Geomobilimonas luticola TaxID=1114878 RepID=A0ABS5S7S4_9BACT|nr:HEPN domain-containing protein [Geomobilimonas luticola]MBT0651427.1 HEPN domain-containing protein [Geomobilimonas luticola]